MACIPPRSTFSLTRQFGALWALLPALSAGCALLISSMAASAQSPQPLLDFNGCDSKLVISFLSGLGFTQVIDRTNGTVIGTSPPAGAQVGPGATITLLAVVDARTQPTPSPTCVIVRVPDLTNVTVGVARDLILRAGLRYADTRSDPSNIITLQNPAPGTISRRGLTVEFNSQAPPPAIAPSTQNPDSKSGFSWPWLAIGVVVIIAAGGSGIFWWTRHRDGSGPHGHPDGPPSPVIRTRTTFRESAVDPPQGPDLAVVATITRGDTTLEEDR